MKTHSATIYHCISCGRITHVNPEAANPHCCGREMAKAAEGESRNSNVEKEKLASGRESMPTTSKN
jgi:DNA-directed RNA polymerase subunit RPC12/RpoP